MALIYNSSDSAYPVHEVVHILGETDGNAKFIDTNSIVATEDIVDSVSDSASGDESGKVVSPKALRSYYEGHQSQGAQGDRGYQGYQGNQGNRGYQGVQGTPGTTGSDYWKSGEGTTQSASSSIHADYNVYAPSFYQNSDERLKTKLSDIEHAVDKVMAIPTIRFYFNNDEKKTGKVGTIAQKVKEVLPEVVSQSEKTGYYSVNYSELSILAIAALKEIIGLLREHKII